METGGTNNMAGLLDEVMDGIAKEHPEQKPAPTETPKPAEQQEQKPAATTGSNPMHTYHDEFAKKYGGKK